MKQSVLQAKMNLGRAHLALYAWDDSKHPRNARGSPGGGQFTSAMIDKLRDEYGSLSIVDPMGPGYRKLIGLLDALDQSQLEQLAKSDIKFVSKLAANRVRSAKARGGESRFDPAAQEIPTSMRR